MKKKILAILILLSLTLLGSCSGYVNSYKAVGMVTSSAKGRASLDFYSLEGTRVINARFSAADKGEIAYRASLEMGEANIYYVSSGEKILLFNLKAGDEIEGRGGEITRGKQTIIVETVEKSRGSLSFEFVAF